MTEEGSPVLKGAIACGKECDAYGGESHRFEIK